MVGHCPFWGRLAHQIRRISCLGGVWLMLLRWSPGCRQQLSVSIRLWQRGGTFHFGGVQSQHWLLPMGLLVVGPFPVALLSVYGYWSDRCGSSWCFLPLEAACFWTRPFLGGEPWFSQCLGVKHVLFWQLCFVVLQAVLFGALWGWCYPCVQVIVRHDWRAVWNVALFMPSSTPCHLLVRMAWMTVVSVLSFAVSVATSSIVIALGVEVERM